MITHNRHNNFIRRALALAILLSGLGLIPFVNLPVAIGWQELAGVYQPELAVGTASGPAGTVFTFTGRNYPPITEASIYIDGRLFATITTDETGQLNFELNTGGITPGSYSVTVEADINASATESITLLPAATATPIPTDTPEPTLAATAAATAAATVASELSAAPTAIAQPDQATDEPAAGQPAERTVGFWLLVIGGLALVVVVAGVLVRRLRS